MTSDKIFAHVVATAARIAPRLADAIGRVGPLPVAPPAHATVADRLFVEVVNQQLSTRAAAAIWSRIEAAAVAQGLPLRGIFTPPHTELLRACGVSANKVRSLIAICQAELAGSFDVDLAAMSHTERRAVLCGIRGIGPWTADMIGIFHCLDPDIWPSGDVAAVASLRTLSGREDTDAVAALFAPYRSTLARYAWRVRDRDVAATMAEP